MLFEAKTIRLKDGRACLLRSAQKEDAAAMLAYLDTAIRQTHFLLRDPQDSPFTLEQEEKYLQEAAQSATMLMLSAFIEGQLAGNCMLSLNQRLRTRHRCSVGISLLQAYWGLGLGTAMMEAMIQAARARGCEQMELEYIEGNKRGLALYQKMGFVQYGVLDNAVHLADGQILKAYLMVKDLR